MANSDGNGLRYSPKISSPEIPPSQPRQDPTSPSIAPTELEATPSPPQHTSVCIEIPDDSPEVPKKVGSIFGSYEEVQAKIAALRYLTCIVCFYICLLKKGAKGKCHQKKCCCHLVTSEARAECPGVGAAVSDGNADANAETLPFNLSPLAKAWKEGGGPIETPLPVSPATPQRCPPRAETTTSTVGKDDNVSSSVEAIDPPNPEVAEHKTQAAAPKQPMAEGAQQEQPEQPPAEHAPKQVEAPKEAAGPNQTEPKQPASTSLFHDNTMLSRTDQMEARDAMMEDQENKEGEDVTDKPKPKKPRAKGQRHEQRQKQKQKQRGKPVHRQKERQRRSPRQRRRLLEGLSRMMMTGRRMSRKGMSQEKPTMHPRKPGKGRPQPKQRQRRIRLKQRRKPRRRKSKQRRMQRRQLRRQKLRRNKDWRKRKKRLEVRMAKQRSLRMHPRMSPRMNPRPRNQRPTIPRPKQQTRLRLLDADAPRQRNQPVAGTSWKPFSPTRWPPTWTALQAMRPMGLASG